MLGGYGGGGGGALIAYRPPYVMGVGVEETVPCLAAGTCSLLNKKGNFWVGVEGGRGNYRVFWTDQRYNSILPLQPVVHVNPRNLSTKKCARMAKPHFIKAMMF